MKKIVLLLLATCFLVTTETVAQTNTPQFGLRAGGNLAQLRGQDDAFGDDATDRKLGFTIGAFAEVPLGGAFSVQPELLYTQKGGSFEETFADEGFEGTLDVDFNLNYLELPVLVKYTVPTGGLLMPSLYAGPYVAYGVTRDIDFDVEDGEGNGSGVSFDADDVFERMDYGAVFGVDFGYRLARRTATIGLRYDLGLANVLKDGTAFSDDGIELDGAEAQTHEVSVVLGVTLF